MKKSFHLSFISSSSSQFAKVCKLTSLVFPIVIILFSLLLLQCAAWEEEDDNEIIVLEESGEVVYTPEELENIVGFGEDCSSEGPFCDERLHLACDNEEEICVCDDEDGYVHIGNLESSDLLEDDIFDLLTEDNSEEKGSSKRICMKSSELEYKMDRLLNITKKIKDFADIFRKYKKYLPKKYQDLLKEEL